MHLKRIEVKNFRCFTKKTVDLDSRIVLLKGANGAGKSSLLEALHYLCYLRSFRAASPRDLIQFGSEGFFIKLFFSDGASESFNYELQVGFANKKRSVKLNGKQISSFKELMDHYRIITLTEDDLSLIKAGPDVRRQFIDQAVLLGYQEYADEVRSYKKILQNRNSLLQRRTCRQEDCELWTTQLWEKTQVLQKRRAALLSAYQKDVNSMLLNIFDEKILVNLKYKPKKGVLGQSFDQFMIQYTEKKVFFDELRFGRSLFGAHLDDISITFQGKKSKQFASRGQQKMIVLLLKVAQLRLLEKQRGPAVLLLDDFMTDFDEKRALMLARFLASLPHQLIFTTPAQNATFDVQIEQFGAKNVTLTI